jgi:hypothetical protein
VSVLVAGIVYVFLKWVIVPMVGANPVLKALAGDADQPTEVGVARFDFRLGAWVEPDTLQPLDDGNCPARDCRPLGTARKEQSAPESR